MDVVFPFPFVKRVACRDLLMAHGRVVPGTVKRYVDRGRKPILSLVLFESKSAIVCQSDALTTTSAGHKSNQLANPRESVAPRARPRTQGVFVRTAGNAGISTKRASWTLLGQAQQLRRLADESAVTNASAAA